VGVGGGFLVPVCYLTNRFGEGVDDDGGLADAEAFDAEVGGLVGVFGGVPEADDDAVAGKVGADALADGSGLGEGEGWQG